MARILGIAGSPRKGGNSDILLDSFLEGAREGGNEVEKIYIGALSISPCDEGNSCHKTGRCHKMDDMQAIYDKLLSADHLVVSSPTFFMGPPAQLKCMIDRCQALWAKRFILNKPLRDDEKIRNGFLLATAGLNKKEAFTGTIATIKAFFYVLGFKYKGELLFLGIDKKGSINSRKGAIEEARIAGKNISRR